MHYLFRGITLIGEERESNRSGSDSVPLLRQNAYHWNTITLPWPIKTSVIFYHLTLQLVQVIKIRLLRSRDIKAFNARLFLSHAKGKENVALLLSRDIKAFNTRLFLSCKRQGKCRIPPTPKWWRRTSGRRTSGEADKGYSQMVRSAPGSRRRRYVTPELWGHTEHNSSCHHKRQGRCLIKWTNVPS